jgi:flagellar biosynthesis GTPase FlhF
MIVYVYMGFIHLYISQSSYGQSKWEARKKNEKKARDRQTRADREKEARKKEQQKRKQSQKKAERKQKQTLDSQASYSEALNFALDMPDWIMQNFGQSWLKMREILQEFQIPSLGQLPTIPNFGEWWYLMKQSEVHEKLMLIVRMLITLGLIKKLSFSYKNYSIFESQPLREKVTIVSLVEEVASFCKLVFDKVWLVIERKDISLLFKSEAKCAYDDEFTFLKSQKVRIDLGRTADIDEETYDRRVAECIDATLTYLNSCDRGERSYYSTRLCQLRDIQSSRVLSKKEGIREKPYGICMYGPSGVGKSAIVNSLVRYILKVCDKDYSPRAVISLNGEDKFQSEFCTYHKGVIFDDLCNKHLDWTDGSPVTPIIMFLNNMPMAALNPNAEMKGKVMIDPDVVVATTNVKSLKSNLLSNEPLSINRRFENIITQTVRPEYRKDGTEMLDPKKVEHMADVQFPNYALFKVEEAYYSTPPQVDEDGNVAPRPVHFRPRYYKGRPLVDVGIATLLEFLKDDGREHFARQRKFVAGQRKLTKIELCEHDMPACYCEHCKLESQMSIPYVTDVSEYLYALEGRCMDWVNDCARRLFATRFGNAFLAYMMRDTIYNIVCNSVGYYLSILFAVVLSDYSQTNFGATKVIVVTLLYVGYLLARFYWERNKVVKKFTEIPRPSTYFKQLSWSTKVKIISALMSIGVWKILVTFVRRWKKVMPTAQAADLTTIIKPNVGTPITLQPDMKRYQKETEFWDVRSREKAYQFGDAGVSELSRTISMDKFEPLLGNRLIQAKKDNGSYCNVVPLKSNLLLVPNHFVPKKTTFVTLKKVGGHTFKDMPLDQNVVQRIPGTDLAVWYCPGAGLHRDLIDYHPKDIYEEKKLEVYTMYNDSGILRKYPKMMAQRGRVITTEGGMFQGLRYSFPEDTFGGLCMAPLIGNAKGIPFIAGYHLAGRGKNGAAGFVTRQMIYDAIAELDKKPGVLISHSAVPLKTKSMGIEFGPLQAPHDKCVTHNLDIDAKIRIHGGHNQPRAAPTSAVVTSVISEAVKSVMDIEKQHGPPSDMASEEHKMLDISGKVDTATKFNSEWLQKAVIDYTAQLSKLPKEELAKVGKISDDVNLAGLDGVLGINAMEFSTSVGFPGKGPKTQVVEKSDRHVDGISCPRDVDPVILAEIAELEATLLRGESINTVFKGSLKDEPTKLTKKKVRVFAAANMPFVMLVRKYFLTTAALFQRNKKITECAVGTVVQSPEWTELFEHIGKHGWDRAIAGDYAKFDGRMSPQFMLAAFKILIKIAEDSGNFGEDDLTIMRGIASEISYPTYDYFGTIVQFLGSNPSGHPLTVIINSIVNSLYMRYTYYAIAAQKKWRRVPLFATIVALMTYGDDNIMTVKKGYDDFNHTAIAAEFAKVGITYTMADKDAASVPFVHLSEASFLKHFAVWDEELGLYRSPVEDTSIAKMLHTHLKSKVLSMEQSSAEAIQNVALKYFESGREVYTKRVRQLEEVACIAGIQGYVGPIPSYDERVQWYKEKFDL